MVTCEMPMNNYNRFVKVDRCAHGGCGYIGYKQGLHRYASQKYSRGVHWLSGNYNRLMYTFCVKDDNYYDCKTTDIKISG